MNDDYTSLPANLPVPENDGAAEHLSGLELPPLRLDSTLGEPLSLAEAARGLLVAYVYPRTGRPGVPLPDGWEDIPGARGCTPQSCGYRDRLTEFERLGASVIGISAQTPEEQREFAEREHIPFPLLSDQGLELVGALGLPTFKAGGMTLYKRLTLIAEAGRITKLSYPVFPPDRDAAAVLAWLAARR
ncbi:MAG: peroxiredoxin [Solirubrobacterales bacterium]